MRYVIFALVGMVALQRLFELRHSNRNTTELLARGGVEIGRRHYPFLVLLHASWLIAIVVALPPSLKIVWPALAVFVALQAARVWIVSSLGPYWTTRIITLKDAPIVRRGPYRFMRHPNYLVVALEIAALPLAFGEVWVAIVFSILNAAILAWRIIQEESVLAPRRQLGAD